MKSMKHAALAIFLILVFAQSLLSQDVPVDAVKARAKAKGLQRLANCRFVETSWFDGDSFQVQDAGGNKFTVRLYGADCLETRTDDATDARRLRAQRRYFGISKFGGDSKSSIDTAKRMGIEARAFVVEKLRKPFSVVTSFADGRGDKRFKRYYAFVVTSDGDDLASLLVGRGHARAYGVFRSTIDGKSQKEYRESLKDLELQAAKKGIGVWKVTDWDSLPAERRMARIDEEELAAALGPIQLGPEEKIDINFAARDDLMRLPGIGESMANRIIEGREYKTIDSLLKVRGIGKKTLEKLKPHLLLK